MFELTPWYLRMIGFKKYRRYEWYDVLWLRGVGQKWRYYTEKQRRILDDLSTKSTKN